MKLIAVRNPPNPWQSRSVDYLEAPPELGLVVYEDQTRQILAHNDSPDLGFRYSLNPYRGCFHGCAYCYARPTHEYLSFGSGVDFERKIVVKPRAAELLREAFERPAWRGELILFSGDTDCYQPLEASYGLTRACLEVCAEYRNPVHVISKGPLIERDLDVLVELHRTASASVSISIPFWDEQHARALEPYVATPARRMKTVQRLAGAGLDVTVNIAPLIPGLTDRDMPKIMEAAADAGASRAVLVNLRLPGSVKQVFEERVRERLPLSADKILARTREMRGGKLYDARFGARMTGEGRYYQAVRALFEQSARRFGLDRPCCSALADTFRRPARAGRQLELFGAGDRRGR